jgi:hypothetical protein
VALSSTKEKNIIVIVVKESNWVKTRYKEPQRVSNVRFCHKKLKICLFIAIWNHGNHDTLFFFNTNSIKNPFDPILNLV